VGSNSHCARIYVCLFSACCPVQVIALRLVASGHNVNIKEKKKHMEKERCWVEQVCRRHGQRTDVQTVAEKTVGTVDSGDWGGVVVKAQRY
jgi:hypothetical protein